MSPQFDKSTINYGNEEERKVAEAAAAEEAERLAEEKRTFKNICIHENNKKKVVQCKIFVELISLFATWQNRMIETSEKIVLSKRR